MDKKIFVYNTLSRKKEPFTPLNPKEIGIYACGVTVYDDCHIGHGLQAVFFDVIRNYLEYAGYKVNYVRNYTDVDDKIIDRAKKLGISPRKLADDMIASSEKDMKSLGVRPATCEPMVSQTIPEIIQMIATLIEKKMAYATKNGDVYYKVRQKQDYGKLSNRKTDELLSQTRDIVSEEKEDSLDFALWKNDTTPEASWDSPWGKGRPGWHIECSAMAKKYLGDSFDFHGGGLDLIFPHHENEIAQSESANGTTYAQMWLHSGLLTMNKQKMSKSLGNSIRIQDFVKNWDGEVLRLSFLQNHYRSNIDFSEDVFTKSRKRLLYYYETLQGLMQKTQDAQSSELTHPEVLAFKKAFMDAMADDFNTALAIGELNKFMRKTNQLLQSGAGGAKGFTLAQFATQAVVVLGKECGWVLGFMQQRPEEFIQKLKTQVCDELGIKPQEVEEAILERTQARQEKNWEKSDTIRNALAKRGILLRDDSDKTTWSLREPQDDEASSP